MLRCAHDSNPFRDNCPSSDGAPHFVVEPFDVESRAGVAICLLRFRIIRSILTEALARERVRSSLRFGLVLYSAAQTTSTYREHQRRHIVR